MCKLRALAVLEGGDLDRQNEQEFSHGELPISLFEPLKSGMRSRRRNVVPRLRRTQLRDIIEKDRRLPVS